MSKQQIVYEIHKAVRKNFPRCSVLLKGIDDLWQADLIDIQQLSKVNKGFKYIFVVIDCFSKYAWAIALKTKSMSEIVRAFKKILSSGRAPDNLQTDFGKEFYNVEFNRLTKAQNINHYSSYSTKKASIVERLIRTLKSKLYKYFSLAGNYTWIGEPLEIVIKTYNDSVHRTTKHKPNSVNKKNEQLVRKNIEFSQKRNKFKRNKFNIGDSVRISKYKSIFEKGYTPNWSAELFTIAKIKKTNPVTYILKDSQQNMILGAFYEQELQKTKTPHIYLIEKILKKKGDKLFVKWLGLSDAENSWINKSAIV